MQSGAGGGSLMNPATRPQHQFSWRSIVFAGSNPEAANRSMVRCADSMEEMRYSFMARGLCGLQVRFVAFVTGFTTLSLAMQQKRAIEPRSQRRREPLRLW